MDRVGAGHQGHVAARPLVRLVNRVIIVIVIVIMIVIVIVLVP